MQTIRTAEPFFYPGGRTGCLLVHGFTGAPKEMHELGEHLAREGYSVLGVRLAGHATRLGDMLRTRKEDWIASVEDGWHMLCGITEQVFIVGLSMGGDLAIHVSRYLPVAGMVLISTPYYFPDERVRKLRPLIPLISRFYPANPKNPGGWFNQQALEDHVAYPRNPLRQAYELDSLVRKNKAFIPNIKIPTQVIHSKDDRYVTPDHAELLYAALGSTEKELVWTDQCGHVVTRDGEPGPIYEHISSFIGRYALN